MTIRVELNPETEARLVAEARSQGVPLEKLAERLLKQALIANSLPQGVLTVDEFHHMLEGMAEGSEKLPNLATESFSRESFYEDRLDGRHAVPPRQQHRSPLGQAGPQRLSSRSVRYRSYSSTRPR